MRCVVSRLLLLRPQVLIFLIGLEIRREFVRVDEPIHAPGIPDPTMLLRGLLEGVQITDVDPGEHGHVSDDTPGESWTAIRTREHERHADGPQDADGVVHVESRRSCSQSPLVGREVLDAELGAHLHTGDGEADGAEQDGLTRELEVGISMLVDHTEDGLLAVDVRHCEYVPVSK